MLLRINTEDENVWRTDAAACPTNDLLAISVVHEMNTELSTVSIRAKDVSTEEELSIALAIATCKKTFVSVVTDSQEVCRRHLVNITPPIPGVPHDMFPDQRTSSGHMIYGSWEHPSAMALRNAVKNWSYFVSSSAQTCVKRTRQRQAVYFGSSGVLEKYAFLYKGEVQISWAYAEDVLHPASFVLPKASPYKEVLNKM
ncbi:hypothetical protein HPB50_009240 [Hyalomma asiaticum]|uniref:Uncharacterized protein n=1 Tax=Hyalomma asiaticum TaxID=266040 RepID=A0ACB7RPV9_HYAAI|nr:hypothetical protein HPB50_009240 [Hyalomma asiaticum]